MAVTIDVTGNWRTGEQFEQGIQVREPPIRGQHPARHRWNDVSVAKPNGNVLCEGRAAQTFTMDLVIPGDGSELRLDYYPMRDAKRGFAIGNRYDGFEGCSVNGKATTLAWNETTDASSPTSVPEDCTVAVHNAHSGGSGRPECWHYSKEDIERYSAVCDLGMFSKGEAVRIELTWKCTRPPVTTLTCNAVETRESRFLAVSPGNGQQLIMAHGLPFVVESIDYSYGEFHVPECPSRCLAPWNGQSAFSTGGVAVKTIHFLGMLHLFDRGHGAWYTPKGDHGHAHFVGDKAGEIVLHWADGTSSAVPLIFGFNLWYSRPWDLLWHFSLWGGPRWNHDDTLFGGNDACREDIREGVCLVDGIRPCGGLSCNGRFIFSLDLGGRELASIAFRDQPELHYHPMISAVTLETDAGDGGLTRLPALSPVSANTRNVSLQYVLDKQYEKNLDRLKHTFYTFVEEHPVGDAPEIPEGYFGPQYDFRPTREGRFAANFLYRNGPELGAYMADTGMGYTAPVSAGSLPSYQYGFGPWYFVPRYYESLQQWFRRYQEREPGNMPGVGYGWSRGLGEVIREAMAFGYDKFVESQVDWLDRTMFEETNPPHWHRSPGLTGTIAREHQVGDVVERGLRENDGHGNCMWGRYMVWHWMGRPDAWNRKHFAATEAAVEWIQWQLDTDTIRPGVRKDVLFTESECADEDYDIYSSYACLFGVKLCTRMADAAGRRNLVERWTALYSRLQQGILDHLTVQTDHGPVWHTAPYCDWQDHSHALVHIQLATDGDTYTPLQDYARGDDADRAYLEISRNTYRYLMKDNVYDCLRTYGYGQGLIAQAALLLDEMHDSKRFMDLLLQCCYLPHLAGWGCPEGIILHRSGKYYLALNGYEGQDSHIADAAKAVRIMLGVDDNDPDRLRIIPRYPLEWKEASIRDYPVLTGTKRQKIGYTYRRTDAGEIFEYELENAPPAMSVRFGPLAPSRDVGRALVNGSEVEFRQEHSGDSEWAWVDLGAKAKGHAQIELK